MGNQFNPLIRSGGLNIANWILRTSEIEQYIMQKLHPRGSRGKEQNYFLKLKSAMENKKGNFQL